MYICSTWDIGRLQARGRPRRYSQTKAVVSSIYIYIYIYICTACVHSVRSASYLGVFVQIQEIPVSIRLFL